MTERKVRKSYPLRIHPDILTAMQRWSDDELRSINGQIEYVLRNALRNAGRLKEHPPKPIKTEQQE
ncbi:MAG: Arc family DNA binding domain-containing protein [Robiginitomaculum sp.]|nr:Arc family DNA binding domain-containing protein [Robiginitomaculum sp.]